MKTLISFFFLTITFLITPLFAGGGIKIKPTYDDKGKCHQVLNLDTSKAEGQKTFDAIRSFLKLFKSNPELKKKLVDAIYNDCAVILQDETLPLGFWDALSKLTFLKSLTLERCTNTLPESLLTLPNLKKIVFAPTKNYHYSQQEQTALETILQKLSLQAKIKCDLPLNCSQAIQGLASLFPKNAQSKIRASLTETGNKPSLHLDGSELGLNELPEGFWKYLAIIAPTLDTLWLNNFNLTEINFKGLENLTWLDLSHNKLSSLPGLENLTQVTWLDLSHNALTALTQVKALSNISTLYLQKNRLIEMPPLGAPEKLGSLNLSGNALTTFPMTLLNCTKLFRLNLSNMRLDSLPEQISTLPIWHLKLKNCGLTALPNGFAEGNLKEHLHELYLSGNSITSWPKDMHLLNLSWLVMENCGLEILPPFIKDTVAQKLHGLNLNDNHLTVLCDLEHLPELQFLWLNNNNLSGAIDLNPFAHLTQTLELGRNQITAVHGLETLKVLSLNLSENQLTQLPGLENLTGLVHLELQGNAFKTLPDLQGLLKVNHLNLANNPLGRLPQWVGQMPLEYLSVAKCGLTDLPQTLGSLNKLKVLNVAQNAFEAWPHALTPPNLEQFFMDQDQYERLNIPYEENICRPCLSEKHRSQVTKKFGFFSLWRSW